MKDMTDAFRDVSCLAQILESASALIVLKLFFATSVVEWKSFRIEQCTQSLMIGAVVKARAPNRLLAED